jgi:integrase
VDVKTAQDRLGHTDPGITLAIYAQATSEADRAAAEKLGEAFMRPFTVDADQRRRRADGGV